MCPLKLLFLELARGILLISGARIETQSLAVVEHLPTHMMELNIIFLRVYQGSLFEHQSIKLLHLELFIFRQPVTKWVLMFVQTTESTEGGRRSNVGPASAELHSLGGVEQLKTFKPIGPALLPYGNLDHAQ